MAEPLWRAIMRRAPIVCPKCSRRFQEMPWKGNCPNHVQAVKVWDQTGEPDWW